MGTQWLVAESSGFAFQAKNITFCFVVCVLLNQPEVYLQFYLDMSTSITLMMMQ